MRIASRGRASGTRGPCSRNRRWLWRALFEQTPMSTGAETIERTTREATVRFVGLTDGSEVIG